ncbi:MAG: GNAT family protein, partial [Pseudomonadota bacterium]
ERLAGKEVELRPLSLDDAEALVLATSESRENYRLNNVPNGLEEAEIYIKKALSRWEDGKRMPFTVCWKGRVVGSTSYSDLSIWQWPPGSGMQRTDRPDVVEIGYTWLAASAQRTRCNTETKYLLLAHAFEAWEVHRVCFRTDERNTRSRNALARLGAQLEGVWRADKVSADGVVRHSAFYSIVREEWPAVKKRLQGFLDK